MKVKITLRFRGREMAHQEYGFQVVRKFIQEVAPYGHPDADPRLIGRGINVMLSPLPRNKRAKKPDFSVPEPPGSGTRNEHEQSVPGGQMTKFEGQKSNASAAPTPLPAAFANNPFDKLDLSPREENG